jgi:hypothetical protein
MRYIPSILSEDMFPHKESAICEVPLSDVPQLPVLAISPVINTQLVFV